MNATATTQARGGSRPVLDGWIITKRNLLTYIRKPDLLVFSTIQPVMFVLLFVYVFGGAIGRSLPANISYVDFLMPGIFVQTAIFGALQTGVGLADDLQKGLIDRFKSLPMARSAVLAGRTAADTAALTFQIILMLIVAMLIGFRFHEGFLEAILAFLGVVMVGYTFTWVAAFAGLSLKTVEAVQASMFTLVFPVVFVSSVFVPVDTLPSWLQGVANANPITIWSDTFRLLVLGDAYEQYREALFRIGLAAELPSLGALLTWSAAWFAGLLAVFAFLGVRVYRRT